MSLPLPNLLVSDGYGNVFDIPELEMVGMSGRRKRLPHEDELIRMPNGSNVFELPGRVPIGYDRRRNTFVKVPTYQGQAVMAVSAFMAPAYSQVLRSAYITREPIRLPLFAYTALGWRDNDFWVTALRVDDDIRQDLEQFDEQKIHAGAQHMLRRYDGNRLVEHLVQNCVERYHCPASQNFVLGRWECPVPTSPACNADCIGCISQQPKSSGIMATQDRLDFLPTVDEIVEFTVPHLQNAPRPIISFGQGCEGEPLLQGKLIEAAIRDIRKQTSRGTININTNACYPGVVDRLCHAGLDSIRVSLNSAQEPYYTRYYNPKLYTFENVLESMAVMRKQNKWISLNYFIFPGLSDDPAEMDALMDILHRYKVDYIQMRNLNIDPEWYMDELGISKNGKAPIGILRWQEEIKRRAPWIRFGYFNPPKEDW